ncbi:MAG: hypothetical protein ACYCWW_06950 [Deltaproteobacteria bacterium]
MRREGFVALGVVLMACGKPSPVDSGQSLPPATAACLVGWWFGETSPCAQTVCHLQNPPAECSFSDCATMSYFGFEPNQILSQGQLAWGPSEHQFSRAGVGDDNDRWAVTSDGGIDTTKADGTPITRVPANGQCQGATLLFEYGQYTRQSPPISTALQGAFLDGGWTAVSY